MPDMFGLPPPGLSAQMPLDPSQLFLQKRPPAPSPAELAQMQATGEVILSGMNVDSISSALDAAAVIGASASKSASFKPPPNPTPPAPNAGLIGGKGPINNIAEASATGRGNPWFNANPIVAFLINYMNCVRAQMLTKLVDGIAVVKSMNMNMELARGLYDTQIAIGEIKKQQALNEAAALIAQAVMSICSAAFAVGVHLKSIGSNPMPSKPGGQGEANTAGNANTKSKVGEGEDVDAPVGTASKPGVHFSEDNIKATSPKQTNASATDNIATPPSMDGKPKGVPEGSVAAKSDAESHQLKSQQKAADQKQLDIDDNAKQDVNIETRKRSDANASFTSADKSAKQTDPLKPASDQSKIDADKQKDAYKADKAKAREQRSADFTKYHGAMASPLFSGLGQIAQAVKSFANAKLEGELGSLNAIVEMLHAWQKNAQQVGSAAQEDMKASSDEVDKILSSLQKLIDDNFKAFTINPRG